MISRRSFVHGATSALVSILPATGTLESLVELQLATVLAQSASSKRITLEDALKDKDNITGIREEYLMQLVREIYGDESFKYVSSFKYDHEGTSSLQMHSAWMGESYKNPRHHKFLTKELEGNPERRNKALDYFSKQERFASLQGLSKISAIISYLETSEGITEYAKMRADEMFREFMLNSGFAGTFSNPYTFGLEKKSPIFFDRSIFGNVSIELTDRLSLSIPVSEEFIKDCIQHEISHARDNFLGVQLEDGLELNNETIAGINDEVYTFIKEGRAYSEMMDRSRQKRQNDNPGQTYNTGYLLAAVQIDDLFKEIVPSILGRDIPKRSWDLFVAMSARLRPYFEESQKTITNSIYQKIKK